MAAACPRTDRPGRRHRDAKWLGDSTAYGTAGESGFAEYRMLPRHAIAFRDYQ